jgi:hypothetical protein
MHRRTSSGALRRRQIIEDAQDAVLDEDLHSEQEEVLQENAIDYAEQQPRPRQHRSASIVSLSRPSFPALEDRLMPVEPVLGLFERPARHPLDTENDEAPEESVAFRSASPAPIELLVDAGDTIGLPTFEESQARYLSVSQPNTPHVPQEGAFMRRTTSSSGTFLSVANGPLARLAAEVRLKFS